MARVTHRCLSPTQGPRDAGSRGAGQAADSPLHPININDPDHLEEGQEDQVQGRGVLVEDLQPVAPRPQREAGGHEEAQQAGQAWTRPVRRLRCPPVCLAPRPGGHPWGPCGTQCPPMLPGPRRVSLSCRDHPLSPRGGGSSDVQRGGLAVHSPVSTSLGTLLGMTPRSRSGVMMLSMFPNMDDRPRLKSIPKKSTAQTGAPGMWSTASVKTMKARPVPEALCNTAQVCRHAPGTHACASIPPGTHAGASTPPGHTRVPAFHPGHTHVPACTQDMCVPACPWDTRMCQHSPQDTRVCQQGPRQDAHPPSRSLLEGQGALLGQAEVTLPRPGRVTTYCGCTSAGRCPVP